jgi:hypothetical protein
MKNERLYYKLIDFSTANYYELLQKITSELTDQNSTIQLSLSK